MCKSHPRAHASSNATAGATSASRPGFQGSLFSMMLMIVFVVAVWMLPCARGEVALLHKANGVYRGASSVVSAVDVAAAAGNAVLVSGDREDRLIVSDIPDGARKLEEYAINSSLDADRLLLDAVLGAEGDSDFEIPDFRQQDAEAADEEAADEDDHHEMPFWARFGHVTGAAIAMLLVSLIGVFLPTLVSSLGRRHSVKRQKTVESLCTAFAAGGFWGLAIIHVFLEAVTFLEKTEWGLFLGPHNSFLNGAFPLALLGYLSLLGIHNLAVTYIRRNQKYSIGKRQSERERVRLALMDASVASVALMFHAFFEGMVAGMRDGALLIWVAAVSIMGHKWAESFALTQQMTAHGLPTRSKVALLSLVLAASPIGAWVGLGISTAYAEATVVGVLNSLSAGILIFVAGHCTGDVFGSHDHEHVHTFIHNDRTSPAIECRKPDEMSCCSVDCEMKPTSGSPVFSDNSLNVHTHASYHAMVSPAEQDRPDCDPEGSGKSGPPCEGHYHYLESDPLDGSFKVLFFRMLFLCLGSGMVFSLMIVHMINSSHDHSIDHLIEGA